MHIIILMLLGFMFQTRLNVLQFKTTSYNSREIGVCHACSSVGSASAEEVTPKLCIRAENLFLGLRTSELCRSVLRWHRMKHDRVAMLMLLFALCGLCLQGLLIVVS